MSDMSKKSTFKPAWWLRNGHLQTLYPALFRRMAVTSGVRRERLETPDQDFVDIDWLGEGDGPLVILLHGLTGCSSSGYIVGLRQVLSRQGLRSVTLNFRGCSGEPNRLARAYHSGDTGDIDFLYRTLRRREPDTFMAAVGFSLGGNVLLKWLGEQGSHVDLAAAAAVSVPLQLNVCADAMDSGFSKVYRDRLIYELKQYMHDKYRHLQKLGQHDEAEKISGLGDMSDIESFWQYDDRVVARLHGFDSAEHYYRLSSSRQFLKKIAIPTLLIQAYDDPFMTPEVLPHEHELSRYVCLEVTQGGGHVGFISGRFPLRPKFWLEQRIPDFIRQQGLG